MNVNPELYEVKCDIEYGVSDKIFDTWTKTYQLLSTFKMIDLNQQWLGQSLYECWEHFQESVENGGKSPKTPFNVVNKFIDIKGGSGGFSPKINEIMKKEIFIMYFASDYINDDKRRESLMAKCDKCESLTPKQIGGIAFLHKLYMGNRHPLVAILIFCQFDMQDFITIGI